VTGAGWTDMLTSGGTMRHPLPSLLSCALLFLALAGCDDGGTPGSDAGSTPGTDSGTTPGTDSGTTPGTDSGMTMSGACAGGPLAAPISGCMPTPAASTGDPAQDCVNRINQFRAECQCLGPLERWTEAEDCADQMAEYDSNSGVAHSGWSGRICMPGGNGQNECPGWGGGAQMIVSGCLQLMWDEGPGEPFSEHGHYLNMSSTRFTRVACGFYTTSGGQIWAVQNFQ
jgi:hypothetical protein